jgi:hypothetical protein
MGSRTLHEDNLSVRRQYSVASGLLSVIIIVSTLLLFLTARRSGRVMLLVASQANKAT